MSTNRIADLGQTVTVNAAAGTVQVADQKMQAFIISAMPEDTAPQARSLKDYPNFVAVEKGGRIVEVQELVTQITTSTRGVQGPPGPPGPPGGVNGLIDELNDVLVVNIQDGQLLKYNLALAQWVNSNYLDGGAF
jgi:hypothetical protein